MRIFNIGFQFTDRLTFFSLIHCFADGLKLHVSMFMQ